MGQRLDVRIDVNAEARTGEYHPLWNWFGYDEPNYTYGADGKKLLKALTDLAPTPPHIRTHNLLTSGDGMPALKWGSTNAYTEDAEGNPVYDWTVMDRIFDAYVEAGNTPFIQVGFMPEALSDDPGPYRHSWSLSDVYSTIMTGWAVPPTDLGKWHDLVAAWASHLVERYGRDTVIGWPWEIWNEPDGHYWKGTIPEFCAMYDSAARAIKSVLPEARVGGPHTCGGFNNEKATTFLREFLTYVTENDSPIDFVAFHAKGQPKVVDGRVQMGVRKHLLDIEANLDVINEFPEMAKLPVIIGESDPEGCAACSARVYPQNAYRNGPLYGAYVVESMLRTYELSRRAGIHIEGAVTWAFCFEDQPYFDGFRDLATNGINKAVLNAFRLLGKLGGSWVETKSSAGLPIEDILDAGVQGAADVNAVATRDETGLTVLVWNYHDDDLPEDGPATVTLELAGLPAGAHRLTEFRMDAAHSNPFATWQEMGAPQEPTADQYATLEKASELAEIDSRKVESDGTLSASLDLPRQGVAVYRLDWA